MWFPISGWQCFGDKWNASAIGVGIEWGEADKGNRTKRPIFPPNACSQRSAVKGWAEKRKPNLLFSVVPQVPKQEAWRGDVPSMGGTPTGTNNAEASVARRRARQGKKKRK